jgi:hypothetical protein
MRSSRPPAALAASQAADDDGEEWNNGVDDGLDSGSDGVNNGHDAVSDGAEDALDLFVLLVTAVWIVETEAVRTYAWYNGAHGCGCCVEVIGLKCEVVVVELTFVESEVFCRSEVDSLCFEECVLQKGQTVESPSCHLYQQSNPAWPMLMWRHNNTATALATQGSAHVTSRPLPRRKNLSSSNPMIRHALQTTHFQNLLWALAGGPMR